MGNLVFLSLFTIQVRLQTAPNTNVSMFRQGGKLWIMEYGIQLNDDDDNCERHLIPN